MKEVGSAMNHPVTEGYENLVQNKTVSVKIHPFSLSSGFSQLFLRFNLKRYLG